MRRVHKNLFYWRGCKTRGLEINLIPGSSDIKKEICNLNRELSELIEGGLLQGGTVLVRFVESENDSALLLSAAALGTIDQYFDSIAVRLHMQDSYVVTRIEENNEAGLDLGDSISVDELTPSK